MFVDGIIATVYFINLSWYSNSFISTISASFYSNMRRERSDVLTIWNFYYMLGWALDECVMPYVYLRIAQHLSSQDYKDRSYHGDWVGRMIELGTHTFYLLVDEAILILQDVAVLKESVDGRWQVTLQSLFRMLLSFWNYGLTVKLSLATEHITVEPLVKNYWI